MITIPPYSEQWISKHITDSPLVIDIGGSPGIRVDIIKNISKQKIKCFNTGGRQLIKRDGIILENEISGKKINYTVESTEYYIEPEYLTLLTQTENK